MRRPGKIRLLERTIHQFDPTIARSRSDGERGVPHPQPWMPPGFKISGRPSKAEQQEIAKPLFRSRQILGMIQRTQHVVRGNLPVERGDQPLKSLLPDDGVNFLFFHI